MPGWLRRKSTPCLISSGDGLEIHRGFVVVRPRVHSEYHEAALREFSRRDQAHEIGGAVDRKEGDRRSGAAVRDVEGPLGSAWTELNISWIGLRQRRRGR